LNLLRNQDVISQNVAVLDSNFFKEMIPEHKEYSANPNPSLSAIEGLLIWDEASDISCKIVARAAELGMPLVVNTRMAPSLKIAEEYKRHQPDAPRVAIGMAIDFDTYLERAIIRHILTNNKVPEIDPNDPEGSLHHGKRRVIFDEGIPDLIKTSAQFPALLDGYNIAYIFDNRGDRPRLIAQRELGKAPEILDGVVYGELSAVGRSDPQLVRERLCANIAQTVARIKEDIPKRLGASHAAAGEGRANEGVIEGTLHKRINLFASDYLREQPIRR
jgi:hypothetical protein